MPHVFWGGAGVPRRIPNSYQRFSTLSPEESLPSLIVEGVPGKREATCISGYTPAPPRQFLRYHPSWSYLGQGGASFTQPMAFCPQNNVLCLHCTSAWLPHRSCSWTCYLQPDSLAVVVGNSAGSSIMCTEEAFLCIRSWRLLKWIHCCWSHMTSGSNPPMNNSLALRYTILHQGTCRTLTRWDYGSSKLHCITDWDLAYPSAEIFGQGHFSAATHTSVWTIGLQRWDAAANSISQAGCFDYEPLFFTALHWFPLSSPWRSFVVYSHHYEKSLAKVITKRLTLDFSWPIRAIQSPSFQLTPSGYPCAVTHAWEESS